MFQLKIKIITTKGPSDKNPSVNWISPDEKMAEYAELKNVELGEMVLLHENDSHFAIVGSLSNRFHVGPHVEETEASASDVEIDYDEDNYVIEDKESNYKDLEKEFKDCQERNKVLEREYILCEKELRKKTEEAEKFKSEVKDLKQMLDLEKQIKDTGLDNNSKDIEDNCGDEENLLNLKKGGFQRKNPQAEAIPNNSNQNIKDNQSNSFKERIKNGWRMKVKEPEYNCLKCDFQGTRQEELDKHIQLKHSSQGMMKCRNCGKEFESKSCLMVHRKTEHGNSSKVKLSKSFPENKNKRKWNQTNRSKDIKLD